MAAMMLNAANVAYRKAVSKTRDEAVTSTGATSSWMEYFAKELPENDAQFAVGL